MSDHADCRFTQTDAGEWLHVGSCREYPFLNDGSGSTDVYLVEVPVQVMAASAEDAQRIVYEALSDGPAVIEQDGRRVEFLYLNADLVEASEASRKYGPSYDYAEMLAAMNRPRMVGTRVAWFRGDEEWDGMNGDEFDGPGWVAFAEMSDGTLAFPSGARPHSVKEEAEAERAHVVCDAVGPKIRK